MIFSSLDKELVNLTFGIGPLDSQGIGFYAPSRLKVLCLSPAMYSRNMLGLPSILSPLPQTQMLVFPIGQVPSTT